MVAPDSIDTLLPQFLQMSNKLYAVDEIKPPANQCVQGNCYALLMAEPTIVDMPPPKVSAAVQQAACGGGDAANNASRSA